MSKKDYIINFCFCLSVCLSQVSFVSGLIWPFSNISLVSIFIIFILILKNFNMALYWSLICGFVLDVFLFDCFGVNLVVFFISIYLINILYVNYFTDKSLYSVLVLFLAHVIFIDIATNLIYYFFALLRFKSYDIINPWSILNNEGLKLIINSLIVIIVFHLFSNNLKPIFLKKQNERIE